MSTSRLRRPFTSWSTAAPAHERLVRRLAALNIVFTLTAPLSWAHYYLLVLVLLPALPGLLGRRLGGVWLVIFGLLTSWIVIARLAPLSNTYHLPMLVNVALMLGTLLLFSVRLGGTAGHD